MQIVIDINDDLYTRLFDNGENYVMDMRSACAAIRNGRVIPKGHGDLIDRKELLNEAQVDGAYGYISVKEIYDAETIIEADTAQKE